MAVCHYLQFIICLLISAQVIAICDDACSSCASGNDCTECQIGYFLSSASDCIACPEFCTSCTDSGNCQSCVEGRYGSGCTSQCSDRCLTCVSRYSCMECKPGFYGDYCQGTCSRNCKDRICSKLDGYCENCVDGIYGNYCTYTCAPECVSCTSRYQCQECIPGRFGPYCSEICPANCQETRCTKDNGACTTCVPGFYGETCDFECPETCVSCSSASTCQSCKPGFYGVSCSNRCLSRCAACSEKYTCSDCNPGFYLDNAFCMGCKIHCISCRSYNQCDKCLDGNFLQNGGCYKCSAGCVNCVSQQVCTECQRGQFIDGASCSTCPQPCTECESRDVCNLCPNGYFISNGQCNLCQSPCVHCISLNDCVTCKPGFYKSDGGLCLPCHTSCSLCDSNDSCIACNSGHYHEANSDSSLCRPCIADCHSCVSDTSCQKCNMGFYWQDAHCKPCHEQCQDCTSLDTCRMCKPGRFSVSLDAICECVTQCQRQNQTVCLSCADPHWYPASLGCCPCNSNCIDMLCDDQGRCNKGCLKGYYGEDCSQNCNATISGCSNCAHLSNSVQCTECETGMYVLKNECAECQSTCLGGQCNPVTGVCMLGCSEGYHGSRCHLACNEDCATRMCSSDDGRCLDGCKDGIWGLTCDKVCNKSCLQCAQENGTCLSCVPSSFGVHCSLNCSSTCGATDGERLCAKDSGRCSHGCAVGFFGDTCSQNCSENCRNMVCRQADGHCSDGCIGDFYGSNCSKVCNANCASSTEGGDQERECSEISGACLHGCKHGFYGFMCQNICKVGCVNGSCLSGNGTCLLGCQPGYTGELCDGKTSKKTTDHLVIGLSVGGALFCIIGVVVWIIVCKRVVVCGKSPESEMSGRERNRIYNNNGGHTNRAFTCTNGTSIQYESTTPPQYECQLMRPLGMSSKMLNIRAEEDGERALDKIESGLPSGNITLSLLQEYVKMKTVEGFSEEFRGFSKGMTKPHVEAVRPENYTKNRYKAVFPYDENRVVLTDDSSSYINASFVDGFSGDRAYIAAQGPNLFTVESFWLMVWQMKCDRIVMLTKLVENEMEKCVQYWPDKDFIKSHGGISVSCIHEDQYAEFIVRRFILKANNADPAFHVCQLHYTSWPDKGVPDDVTGLVEFRRKLYKIESSHKGPIVVHCSAGIGRTGTFIALDVLTNEGESRGTVNIPACVENLRQQRVDMIQTVTQYQFLHRALVFSLATESTPIQCKHFQSYINKATISMGSERCTLQNQFLKLENLLEDTVEFQQDSSQKTNSPEESGTVDEIYVNGYRSRDMFLIVQSPEKGKLNCFLQLIMKSKCECLVTMTAENICWKAIAKMKTLPYRVEVLQTERTKIYVRTKLRISAGKEQVKTVSEYAFLGWNPATEEPKSPQEFVNYVQYINNTYLAPLHSVHRRVLLHDRTGVSRCGLFCVIYAMMEKAELEDEVSLFNVVWQLKVKAREIIPSFDQYRFCHSAAEKYLLQAKGHSTFRLE